MIKNFLVLIVFLFNTNLFCQTSKKYTIKGVVVDENKAPLAEVFIYTKSNQRQLESLAFSNAKGVFSLTGATVKDSVNILFDLMGYQTKTVKTRVVSQLMDTIKLVPKNNVLDEVVIKNTAPIVIKKDTIEFRASAFKTSDEAAVEDLLKKIPGIRIDLSGKIKINDSPIDKILLDGEPFFITDYRIITKNIKKGVVDKIQLTTSKTEKQKFFNEKGDGKKAINITLKRDKKKGAFGNLSAGFGNETKYEANGFANLYSEQRRLGLIGSINNINIENGLSGIAYPEMRAGESQFKKIGANYNDRFGTMKLRGSYEFKDNQHQLWNKNNKQIFTKNSFYNDKRCTEQFRLNQSHRVILNLDNTTDKVRIGLHLSGFVDALVSKSTANSQISDYKGEIQNLYDADAIQATNKRDFTIRNELNYKLIPRRLKLSVRLETKNERNDANGFRNQNIVYKAKDSVSEQKNKSHEDILNINSNIDVKWNFDKKNWLTISYDFIKSDKELTKTFLDTLSARQIDFLNRDYKQNENARALKISYTFFGKKANFSFIVNQHVINQKHKDYFRPKLSANYTYEYPAVTFRSSVNVDKFLPNANFSFWYNMQTILPTVEQKLNFSDRENPFYTIIGNANLKEYQKHDFQLNLLTSKLPYGLGDSFLLAFRGNVSKNAIIRKTDVDDGLKQKISFVNFNDVIYTFGVNANTNYNFFNTKNVKLDAHSTVSYNFGSMNEIFNDELISQQTHNYSVKAGLQFSYKKLLDLSIDYGFLHNAYSYLEFNQNIKNISHTINSEIKWIPTKRLRFGNSISYSNNPTMDASLDGLSFLWNAHISYSLLDNRITTYLKVYDILGMKRNAYQKITGQVIENYQTNVLNRFLVVGLRWSFNTNKNHILK